MPATSYEEAQRALQRAEKAKAEVAGLRNKTEKIADDTRRLVAKNHFAEGIRRSLS